MQHPDEGTIHAWLDGELSADESAALEAHAAECSECAARIAEARGLVAASTRILTALDDIPAGVIPAATIPSIGIARRRWYDRTDIRAAAALLFVAAASLVVVKSRNSSAPLARTETASLKSTAAVSADASGAESKLAEPPQMQSAAAPAATAPATSPQTAALKAASHAPTPPSSTRDRRQDKPALEKDAAKLGIAAAPVSVLRDAASNAASNAASGTVAGVIVGAAAGVAGGRSAAKTSASANEVVVTGVTEATDAVSTAPLRQVRVDTRSGSRRTVYQLPTGVEVTLLEAPPAIDEKLFGGIQPQQRRAAETPQRLEAAPAPPPPVAAATAVAPMNTIAWTEGGRKFTLSGRLSTTELEALKKRLMQIRR